MSTSPRAPSVRAAIEAGDVAGLRARLQATPAAANQTLRWGPLGCNRCVPLHYVCDRVYSGDLDAAASVALVEALIEAGADVQVANDGGTLLIAAASLGAEDVGLRLLAAGTDPLAVGLYAAAPLHWAAMLGLDRLTGALLDAGADFDLRDREFGADALGWAIHGVTSGAPGGTGRQPEAAVRLLVAGATVTDAHRASLDPARHAAMCRVVGMPSG